MKLTLFFGCIIFGVGLLFYGAQIKDPFDIDLNYWEYTGLCLVGFSFILWHDQSDR
jgi:hypothetical protein